MVRAKADPRTAASAELEPVGTHGDGGGGCGLFFLPFAFLLLLLFDARRMSTKFWLPT